MKIEITLITKVREFLTRGTTLSSPFLQKKFNVSEEIANKIIETVLSTPG